MATPHSADPSLADKVAFLRHRAWPGEAVEPVETHMSWVFLVGDRAHKLKKPVRKPFVDLRTIEARHADCEAEVELNEPLAPGVYLGVERLCVDETGDLHIGDRGRVVDWLVVMRRLDRRRLLDRRIAAGTATPADLDPVLDLLVAFYRTTAARPAEPDTHRRLLAHQVESDVAPMSRPAYGLDDAHRRIGAALLDRIAGCEPLASRAARLVDGHGDLRPEHVLPGPDPLVIDRLSFDARLRRIDPAMDLALLAVECDRLGAPHLARHVLDGYRTRADDPVGDEILRLYQAIRALTRASLTITHIDDRHDDADRRRWETRSEDYLRIAAKWV